MLHEHSAITECPSCHGDLRSPVTRPCAVADQVEIWRAASIVSVIEASAAWYRPLEWKPREQLNELRIKFQLSPTAFARRVGTSKVTAWYWMRGRARPSLASTLHICHCFGISLKAFLSREGIRPDPDGPGQTQLCLRFPRRTTDHDWAAGR